MPPKSSKASAPEPAAAVAATAVAASSSVGKPKKAKGSSSTTTSGASSTLFSLAWVSALLYGVYFCVMWAYRIRLQAIEEFGPVIHEFDPWFNYRATEYLYLNGADRFWKWFDYQSWYPLGRPVGTTIYPGMQFTAVYIKNYLTGDRMSLNDVCCYMPAWFGALATVLIGCLTYECSLPENTSTTLVGVLVDALKGRRTDTSTLDPSGQAFRSRRVALGLSTPALECAVFAMGFMAVVPAHLMRSVGGGFDNESVAISAMGLTFLLWVRSLRAGDANRSHWYGALAGLAYFYMAAAWGGYVFVLNLVGCHAAVLVLTGRFSRKVYLSYSLFYAIGTALAVQVPVVGWTPLKALEQLGPALVFLGYQVLYGCEVVRIRNKLGRAEAWKLRVKVVSICAAGGIVLLVLFMPKGSLVPISSRVRALFVKHTKTGNPLVDSVAEHQPANNKAYFQYLHHLCTLAPIGLLLVTFNFGDGPSFLVVYATAAYFFSHKMVRLILLTGPIAAALSGIVAGRIVAWAIRQVWDDELGVGDAATADGKGQNNGGTSSKRGKKSKNEKRESSFSGLGALSDGFNEFSNSKDGKTIKKMVAATLLVVLFLACTQFKDYSWAISASLSNPTIILKGQLKNGEVVYVDDFREAYWWLRDNTPADARVMAWWDYGYQITGISNRTTIADGNTWNHEHIALLGKILTGEMEESYQIARHLADYVLVWGGGGGDDLAKSPHLARIANSVYREHCPDDPTCRAFGMSRQGMPSPMMSQSFLFKLHSHNIRPGVTAPADKFEEVYRSKYGKVRIYKLKGVSEESKRWVADPKNRRCDVPGSWYCPGQYPPALNEVLSRKKDFAQLEDFNKNENDDEYTKKYFENLHNPQKAKRAAEQAAKEGATAAAAASNTPGASVPKPTQAEIDAVYNKYEDSDESTLMWQLVSQNNIAELEAWLEREPIMAYLRSSDGRGPMWWAFENRNQEIVKFLMKLGVPIQDADKSGKTPVQLLDS